MEFNHEIWIDYNQVSISLTYQYAGIVDRMFSRIILEVEEGER